MSRRSRIQAIRKELMVHVPAVRWYVPYVFTGTMPKTSECPNCHRQCSAVKVTTDPKRITDVLVCAGCEHFAIYEERAA